MKTLIIITLLLTILPTFGAEKKSRKNDDWFEDKIELNQSAPLRRKVYNKKKYEKVFISGVEILVEKQYYDPNARPKP